MEDRCICCGEVIPEGRQVCYQCSNRTTEVKIEVELKIKEPHSILEICPYCFGSGKLRAMQRAMTYDAGSVRAADTYVKCNNCKGTGRKY